MFSLCSHRRCRLSASAGACGGLCDARDVGVSRTLRIGGGLSTAEQNPANWHSIPFCATPGPYPGSRSLANFASAGTAGMPRSRTDDPGPAIVAADAFVAEPEAADGGIDFQPPATPPARRMRNGPHHPAYQINLPFLLVSAVAFHGDSLTESGADSVFAPYRTKVRSCRRSMVPSSASSK